MRTISTAGLVLALALGACGDVDETGISRGQTPPRGQGKADGTTSCIGVCGKQAPGGCWCDAQCATYGDCCADKKQACDASTPTCAGSCGKRSPDGCWCDSLCTAQGDCCPDKAQICDLPPPSCKGYCGKKSPSGCWCNAQCEVYGDCCADKKQVCDGPTPGQDCTTTSECGNTMKCIGKPADGSSTLGKCNSTAPLPGEGDSCSATQGCATDLVCAGYEIWGTGNCAPTWMTGTFSSSDNAKIPYGAAGLTSSVVVRGLATVPVDIAVTLQITHPRPSDLTITLTDPNGVEATVWNQTPIATPDLNTRIIVAGISRDDAVNGRWTLKIADLKAGSSGTLDGWSLELTSRWD